MCPTNDYSKTSLACSSQIGYIRVTPTSGKFGHTFASTENPDETVPNEPSHQDFHCLLIYFIFYYNN